MKKCIKKVILSSTTLCLLLCACGNDTKTSETVAEQGTTGQETTLNQSLQEEQTKQVSSEENPKEKLIEIDNWVIGSVWNEGFCDFYHYEENGTGSTGESIDIEFAWERFQKNYDKKGDYDAFISSLPDEYSNVKDIWKKLINESDKLYEHYQQGIENTGTSADTAIFVQYRDAFSDEVSNLDTEDNEAEELEDSSIQLNNFEVEKGIFDVTITIPAEFMRETSQEELDEAAAEIGYKVKLNDDGSATYTMTKSQHKQMMDEITDSLTESINEMVGSEDYPNFTKIETNSDFTNFIVTTKSLEPDLNESFSVMGFYMFGGIYNIFNGTEVDNIHVEFVNADSGEVISSSDSKE